MSTSPTPNRSRRPAGTPTGGQFAPETHAEPEVTLGAQPPEPESTPTTDAVGTTRWHNTKGQLHREGGPAVEQANGTQGWYLNGQPHREGGPAYRDADGDEIWYLHGQIHREGGPAISHGATTRMWLVHGAFHLFSSFADIYAEGSARRGCPFQPNSFPETGK